MLPVNFNDCCHGNTPAEFTITFPKCPATLLLFWNLLIDEWSLDRRWQIKMRYCSSTASKDEMIMGKLHTYCKNDNIYTEGKHKVTISAWLRSVHTKYNILIIETTANRKLSTHHWHKPTIQCTASEINQKGFWLTNAVCQVEKKRETYTIWLVLYLNCTRFQCFNISLMFKHVIKRALVALAKHITIFFRLLKKNFNLINLASLIFLLG